MPLKKENTTTLPTPFQAKDNHIEKVNWKAKYDETETLKQKMYFRGIETKCISDNVQYL